MCPCSKRSGRVPWIIIVMTVMMMSSMMASVRCILVRIDRSMWKNKRNGLEMIYNHYKWSWLLLNDIETSSQSRQWEMNWTKLVAPSGRDDPMNVLPNRFLFVKTIDRFLYLLLFCELCRVSIDWDWGTAHHRKMHWTPCLLRAMSFVSLRPSSRGKSAQRSSSTDRSAMPN